MNLLVFGGEAYMYASAVARGLTRGRLSRKSTAKSKKHRSLRGAGGSINIYIYIYIYHGISKMVFTFVIV